jgi:hypothetical protein
MESNETSSHYLEESENLKSNLVSFIGERFYEEYINNVSIDKELEDKDLSSLVEHCQKLGEDANKYGKYSNLTPIKFLDNLFDRLEIGEQVTEKDNVIKSILPLILVILLSPVYLLSLGFKGAINLRSGHSFSKLAVGLKVMSKHLDRIEEKLKKEATDKFDLLKNKLEEEYTQKRKKLSEDLSSISYKLDHAEEHVLSSFVFDEESVKNKLLEPLKQKEKELEETLSEVHHFRSMQSSIQKEGQDIERKLQEELTKLESSYMTYNPDNLKTTFDLKFLLDIKGNTPKYFELKKDSYFFIYDEEEESETVDKFISLLFYQLRCKLMPTSYVLKLWDSENLGVAFRNFQKEEVGINIVTLTEEIPENLEDLFATFKRRWKSDINSFEDIIAYNDYMLEIESIAETFHFLIILQPPDEIVKKEYFSRLLKFGPKLGLFILIFQDIKKMRKELIPLLKDSGKIGTFTNGEFGQLAKTSAVKKVAPIIDLDPKILEELIT